MIVTTSFLFFVLQNVNKVKLIMLVIFRTQQNNFQK